jgi:hypothetical protein
MNFLFTNNNPYRIYIQKMPVFGEILSKTGKDELKKECCHNSIIELKVAKNGYEDIVGKYL